MFQSERRTLLSIPEIIWILALVQWITKFQIRRILRHPSPLILWPETIYVALFSVRDDWGSKTSQRISVLNLVTENLVRGAILAYQQQVRMAAFGKVCNWAFINVSRPDASNCSEMFCKLAVRASSGDLWKNWRSWVTWRWCALYFRKSWSTACE